MLVGIAVADDTRHLFVTSTEVKSLSPMITVPFDPIPAPLVADLFPEILTLASAFAFASSLTSVVSET